MSKRTQWASGIGFLMATAGAAIGLGNLWKFPYLMGKNGGFAFLIAYLVFVLVLGLPVMVTEMSLGRLTQKNPIGAYRSISKKATFIGVIGVLAAFIILSYYSVIGGWLLKYIASYATTFRAPADFEAYIATPAEPVVWHFVFMLATALICWAGTRGIEKASKIMMPCLLVLLIVIMVRSLTLPGAEEGLKFVFTPTAADFTLDSISAALGQVFYSLSLGMGITLTYGSYLNKQANIPRDCAKVAGLDTLIALMAGVAIFPAVFSFGLEPAQGPGLIFGTLPKVFEEIAGGSVFALLFFILMLFAAITSSIALLECIVAFTVDNLHWSRSLSVAVVGGTAFILGIFSSLSFGPLKEMTILHYSFFDFVGMLTDNILLPIGGLFMCIYVGWIWGPGKLILEIEENGVIFKLKKAWIWCVRLLTPALILVVMVMGLINVFHVIQG